MLDPSARGTDMNDLVASVSTVFWDVLGEFASIEVWYVEDG